MEPVAQGAIWHPGQAATLRLGPKAVLAEFGALHPALTRHFDVDGPVMAVQIFLDAIPAKRASGPARAAFAPPALQAVRRDFAFLAPETLAAADLVRAVKGADKGAIAGARLFDRFAGQGVPEGQVSLAVEVELQPAEKSFTDADLKAIADRIVAAAAKLARCCGDRPDQAATAFSLRLAAASSRRFSSDLTRAALSILSPIRSVT